MLDASLHRRLFRHLLREAGYLPDRVARKEIKKQIIHRFRHKSGSRLRLLQVANHGEGDSRERDAAIATIQRRLTSGESALKTLRNANYGGIMSLYKVLLYAYGRTGKRRNELLGPLLVADANAQSSTADNSLDSFVLHVPTKAIFNPPSLSKDPSYMEFGISEQYSRLKRLLESHVVRGSKIRSNRHTIKSTVLKVRRYNLWGRPIPQKRVKNRLNQWYRKIMTRLLPPLSPEDWDHLKQLSAGTKPVVLVLRRTRPVGKPEHLNFVDLTKALALHDAGVKSTFMDSRTGQIPFQHQHLVHHLVRYRRHSEEWLKDGKCVNAAFDDILDSEAQVGQKIPVKHNTGDEPRELTQRAIRRLYQKVFRLCPYLSQDKTAKWHVVWGSDHLDRQPATSRLANLFTLLRDGPSSSLLEKG
jgi:hypothetical protein